MKAAVVNGRRFSGLLPVCSYCKSIRDDADHWHQVDEYVAKSSEAGFSHGICPKCLETIVKPQLHALLQEGK